MAAAACPIARRRSVLILPGSFHSPDSTSTSSLTALRAGAAHLALDALTRRGLVIGRDDAAHQLMADHIGRGESNVADALDVFK